MNETAAQALKNWLPYRLYQEAGTDGCRWLYLGDQKITEPFFDDTISVCRQLPENSRQQKCISSLSMLPEWSEKIDSIAPTAIFFHVSRCGSTLVAQLLNMQPANIVLSEVPFFDALLRQGKKNADLPAILPLLKAAIGLYGARRTGEEKNLFIKTDSWHIHFYKELRGLYPEVPFIFLYRQPAEVIRSQQKKRGMQSVQGVIEPAIFGFDPAEIMQLGLDEYMAKVMETYLQAFIKILPTDPLAFAVNYKEEALPIIKKIAAITGISISETEMVAMQQRSAYHGKYPELFFAEAVPEEAIPAYLDKATALYNEVERIRLIAL